MSEAFFEAVRGGRAAEVTSLLERDPGLARARQADGASAVLVAIYHGHGALVPLLEAAGAELDFWESCAAGRQDRALSLLEADRRLAHEVSPDGYSPLALAIFFGCAELARVLLARGGDVNAISKNAQGVAPLHAAAARRDTAMVRALLENGADPNLPQASGFTALDSAAFHGDREMAEVLLAHGADPRRRGAGGKSAADLAEERGHAELSDWLRALP